jgi:16S rRNA (adenine1518-N6/adenine1519-N6)-dimethyltransferase
MNLKELKAVLRTLGIRPSKSLGQHFIINDEVIDTQIAYAHIQPNDIVLEIGPGIGTLTQKLANRARKVIGIEKDNRFARYLQDVLPSNVEIWNLDVLKIELPQFDKLVANIPYNISSPLTFKLLQSQFKLGVLMYQQEFAERMTAPPGTRQYSRLTVNIYYRADCNILRVIPKDCFYPVPEVDSALVAIIPRAPPFKLLDEKLFFELLKLIFSQRRKKLRNVLINNWHLFYENKQRFLELVDTLPYMDARGETLTPEELGKLSDALKTSIRG